MVAASYKELRLTGINALCVQVKWFILLLILLIIGESAFFLVSHTQLAGKQELLILTKRLKSPLCSFCQ